MKSRFLNMLYFIGLSLATFPTSWAAVAEDEILNLLPGDAGMILMVPNLQELEGTMRELGAQLGYPASESFVAEVAEISPQIVVNTPLAMIFSPPKQGDPEPTKFFLVKDFAAFLQDVKAVDQGEGIWQTQAFDNQTNYFRQQGNYVIVADTKELLDAARPITKSLKETLGPQATRALQSQIYFRFNLAPWRRLAEPKVQQMKAMFGMLPLMVGMNAPGIDPMAISNAAKEGGNLLEQFYRQLDAAESFVTFNANVAHFSLATHFLDGDIQKYLSAIKPGSDTYFQEMPAANCAIVFGYEAESSGTSFLQTMMEKFALSGEDADKLKELYINFWQQITSYTGGIQRSDASNQGRAIFFSKMKPKDAQKLVDISVQVNTHKNPLPGMNAEEPLYKNQGVREIAGHQVHVVQLDLDSVAPQMQDYVEKIYGENSISGVFQAQDSVFQFQGSEEALTSFVNGLAQSSKLSTGAQATFAALPKGKNFVALVDIAAALGFIKTFSSDMSRLPDLPIGLQPVGMSLSLAKQAQFDLHVPVQTIVQYIKAGQAAPRTNEKHGAATDGTKAGGSGKLAPSWELMSHTGEKVSLANLRGKVVVMDFWASWCKPCLMAMPGLQKLHEKYANKPVKIVGINVQEMKADKAEEIMNDKKYSYTFLLNGDAVADKYSVYALPTYVIISPQGEIILQQSGYSGDESEMEKIIEQELAKMNP